MEYYQRVGWSVKIVNPSGGNIVKIKSSTRGKPVEYSYGECALNGVTVEIRNNIKVTTHHCPNMTIPAALCLDIAVIEGGLSRHLFRSENPLPNSSLVTFGEVKHMSAFPELMASFIGMLHEMQPNLMNGASVQPGHPNPFLFVSGTVGPGATTIQNTMQLRAFNFGMYHRNCDLLGGRLPVTPKTKKKV